VKVPTEFNISAFKLSAGNLILAALLMVSCEKPKIVEDNELIKALYANSKDTLRIGGNKYILETYIYRNLMPGGPIPEKRPVIAGLYLVNADTLPVPGYMDITRLYVINGREVWISEPVDGVQPHVPDFKLNKLSRDGPEWETGVFVDVIATIVDNSAGKGYLLIARDQLLERVE